MGIAITLQEYLDGQGVAYECVEHRRTGSSASSAEASHVPADSLAKAVVLKRRDGYILAIVPASRQVRLDEVGGWLHQTVGLATQEEIVPLFPDCAPGAVPPIAAAYGLRSLVDESLEGRSDIYFEGGDHRTLVHLSGEQFHKLMAKRGRGGLLRAWLVTGSRRGSTWMEPNLAACSGQQPAHLLPLCGTAGVVLGRPHIQH